MCSRVIYAAANMTNFFMTALSPRVTVAKTIYGDISCHLEDARLKQSCGSNAPQMPFSLQGPHFFVQSFRLNCFELRRATRHNTM